jgi:anti-sigma factor RsiW
MEECEHDAWLSGLLDGELTEEQQRQLRQHLQKCARCRKLLGELEAVEQGLGAVPTPAPVVWEALWQTVAQGVAGASEVRAPEVRWRWRAAVLSRLSALRWWWAETRPRWALAVAATVLALLVGVWALSSILSGAKPGPRGPSPSGGLAPIALAPADALDVEIDQSEGQPGSLLLVSPDGKVAVVWVTSDQPTGAVPES